MPPTKTIYKLTHDDVRNALPQGDSAKELQCPVCGHGHLQLFGTDGIKCQNGCSTEDVVKAIRAGTCAASSGDAKKPKKLKPSEDLGWRGYSVDDHCKSKRLDRGILQYLLQPQDLTRRGKTVMGQPYFSEDGKILATKIRLSHDSHDTYFEPFDPHVPYGLASPLLKNLVPKSYDFIWTEGESDCQTLQCWGFIALGISGSQGWQPEFAGYQVVQNARRVFISEDRKDGAVFTAKILKDMPHALVLRWPEDVNDPSDLHLKYADALDDPNAFEQNPFVQAIDTAIQHATLEKALRQPTKEIPKPTIRDAAFYGLAGEVVQLLEPVLETCPAAILSNFLAVAGILFQHEAFCKVVDDVHYPADYFLTVGNSAVARKGTTTNAMLQLIERVKPGFKDRILYGLSTGQGLITALVKEKSEDDSGAMGTPEAIAASVMVEISEFAELLAVMSRDENTLSAVLRNAWDGKPLVVLTRKEPLKVQNVSIAQVAHITQRELLSKLTSTDRANGFANRYQFVWSERVKLLPRGDISRINYSDVVVKLHKAVEAAKGLGEVKRDADAEWWWAEEYKRLTGRGDSMIDALLGRADAHVVRLSLLYALLDGSAVISIKHLKAALAFWDYCEASVRYVFSQPDAIDEKILEKLQDGPLTTGEIRRLVFGDNKPTEWVTDRMLALEEKGKVRRDVKVLKTGSKEAWCAR